jgi:hypothetical protein
MIWPYLVDRPIHVAPPAGDLHIGLVDMPAVSDGVSTGPGGVDEERRQPLHPPVHGDVIDLDPTLGQEIFDIAVGEPEPQVPAHRENDHLRREPEALERRARNCGDQTSMRSAHPTTVAIEHGYRPMQQSPGG